MQAHPLKLFDGIINFPAIVLEFKGDIIFEVTESKKCYIDQLISVVVSSEAACADSALSVNELLDLLAMLLDLLQDVSLPHVLSWLAEVVGWVSNGRTGLFIAWLVGFELRDLHRERDDVQVDAAFVSHGLNNGA